MAPPGKDPTGKKNWPGLLGLLVKGIGGGV